VRVSRKYFAIAALVGMVLSGSGCGGAGGGTQPPPPSPDFSVGVSSSTVDLIQGGASSPFNISVAESNGFSGSVQVDFSGLPQGVTTNPPTPISVTPGQPVMVIFGAASNASVGQFGVMAQGTSGSLSHSAPFSVSVQSGVVQDLPRSTYLKNDSVALVDTPPGEPRRKQVVFDSVGKRFFVANRSMNRVEVYDSNSLALQSNVDVPAAASVDLSADGATLWVGTGIEQIYALDTPSLQVKARYTISGVSPIPGVAFNRPNETLALGNGILALRLRQPASAKSLLTLWNPNNNSFTDLTSTAPAVFQNGLGVLTRSGDRSRLLAAATDGSGQVVVYTMDGKVVAGPLSVGTGTISFAAMNQDGTLSAILLTSAGSQTIQLLDSSLKLVASYSATDAVAMVFSRDGQSLFVSEAFGSGRVVTALTTPGLQMVGQVPDLAVQGVATQIEEASDAQLLCGKGNRGIALIDVKLPGSMTSPVPLLASVPVAEPSEGPNTGGTAVTLSGSNFPSGALIKFGTQNPIQATVNGSTAIEVVSPASVETGAVNMVSYFSNGWIAVAPGAFSFGTSIEAILPNATGNAGGDTVYIFGHGFGSDVASLSVKVGGVAAVVKKVEALPTIATALGFDTTYPFPLERITITTPAGTPGKVDMSVSSAAGSSTQPKSFQFLAASQTFANPVLYKFLLYDQSRQQLYLSATDHVDVFDLTANVFRKTITPPPNGPPPDAALRGLAMTPDQKQLIVADFGSQNIYLIDPTGAANNGTKVSVGGVAGFLNSGPARVAATSTQTVFVGLNGEGGGSGNCSNCLGQLNLSSFPPTYEPAPQPEVNSITGAPLLQGNQTGDTVYLAFESGSVGPLASWSATAPNSFALSIAKSSATDLDVSPDGNRFATRTATSTEIRGADLSLLGVPTSRELENIPGRVAVPGIALHPSGALVYEPFLDGPPPAAPPATGVRGGIDIRDAANGKLRLRLYLPEPFSMLSTDVDGLHGSFLALDEYGQKLFALTTSGLTVVQLASVPLGIGGLSPSSGTIAGGTSVTIRGSGFKSGIQLTLGGKSAKVVFKDMNTLSFTTPPLSPGAQQLVLTNPDGESVSLDAAFLAQ